VQELSLSTSTGAWSVLTTIVDGLCVPALTVVGARTCQALSHWFDGVDSDNWTDAIARARDRKEWRRLSAVGIAAALGLLAIMFSWTWTSVVAQGQAATRGYVAALAITDAEVMLLCTFWLLSYWRARVRRQASPEESDDPDGLPAPGAEPPIVERPLLALLWVFRLLSATISAVVIVSAVRTVYGDGGNDRDHLLLGFFALAGVFARAIEASWANRATSPRGHCQKHTRHSGAACVYGWLSARTYLLPALNAVVLVIALVLLGTLGVGDLRITSWEVGGLIVDLSLTYGMLEVNLPLEVTHKLHIWCLRLRLNIRHPIAWSISHVPEIPRTVGEWRSQL
jgi:hypothetical protein